MTDLLWFAALAVYTAFAVLLAYKVGFKRGHLEGWLKRHFEAQVPVAPTELVTDTILRLVRERAQKEQP